MGCGCSGSGVQKEPAQLESELIAAELSRDAVLLEYQGDSVGTLTFTPPINPVQSYYFGANDGNRIKYVLNAHVAWFLELNYAGKNLFRQPGKGAALPSPIPTQPALEAGVLPSMDEFAREARAEIPAPAQGG